MTEAPCDGTNVPFDSLLGVCATLAAQRAAKDGAGTHCPMIGRKVRLGIMAKTRSEAAAKAEAARAALAAERAREAAEAAMLAERANAAFLADVRKRGVRKASILPETWRPDDTRAPYVSPAVPEARVPEAFEALSKADARRARRDAAKAKAEALAKVTAPPTIGHAPNAHAVRTRTDDDGAYVTRNRRTILPDGVADVLTEFAFDPSPVVADGAYAIAAHAVQRYVSRGRTNVGANAEGQSAPRTSVDGIDGAKVRQRIASGGIRLADVHADALADAAQSAVIAWQYGADVAGIATEAPEGMPERQSIAYYAVIAYRAAIAHGMTGQDRGGRRSIADADAGTLSIERFANADGASLADIIADGSTAMRMLRNDGKACKADVACGVHVEIGHTEGCADCAALWQGAIARFAATSTNAGTLRKDARGRKADAEAAARTMALAADGTLSMRAQAAALGISYAALRKRLSRVNARANASA